MVLKAIIKYSGEIVILGPANEVQKVKTNNQVVTKKIEDLVKIAQSNGTNYIDLLNSDYAEGYEPSVLGSYDVKKFFPQETTSSCIVYVYSNPFSYGDNGRVVVTGKREHINELGEEKSQFYFLEMKAGESNEVITYEEIISDIETTGFSNVVKKIVERHAEAGTFDLS